MIKPEDVVWRLLRSGHFFWFQKPKIFLVGTPKSFGTLKIIFDDEDEDNFVEYKIWINDQEKQREILSVVKDTLDNFGKYCKEFE